MIDVELLHKELKAGGVLFVGCSDDGRIDFTDNATEDNKRKTS